MTDTAKNRLAEAIRRGERLPELLSPAGSYTALMAAIDGGADAVYMGGVAFNARINAKNFTEDELKKGIALAHSYGVKVYIAANTLVYDRELDGFLRAAEHAYLCGADALIIADVGAAAEVKKRIPIELHASTQMSGHGSEMAHMLEKSGFSRMVCAREMSKADIKSFIDASPLEAEVFVHGALCVCHSGQCLFSSLVGGRSGNRGECAQPCRLPYRGANGEQTYPLSLKDLTLAMHLPELCRLGVSSLKIEGRMKSPEYVREVTAIWRRLLDSKSAATPKDISELEDVFSRGGFTDAYFTGRMGRGMLGVRTDRQKQISKNLPPFEGINRKLALDMHMEVRANRPIALTVTRSDTQRSVTVYGEIPQMARTAPVDEATVLRGITKLGNTPYTARSATACVDAGQMIPVSAINALRRSAIEKLEAPDADRGEAELVRTSDRLTPKGSRGRTRSAVFFEPSQISSLAREYFDVAYLPIEKYDGSVEGVMLPPVIFDSEMPKIESMLSFCKERGARHVLVGNLGHLDIAKRAGLIPHADLRLNACNSATVACLEEMGFEDVILSPELSLAQLRDIGGRTGACVYGRIPLMVTEKCVGKELGGCQTCKEGKTQLVDRMGVSFPVLRSFEHRSVIFNSAPLYMADKRDELLRSGITMQHYIFTVESAEQVDRVIRSYRNGEAPNGSQKFRRIK